MDPVTNTDPNPPVDPAVVANVTPPAADPPAVVDPAVAPAVDPPAPATDPAAADPVDPKPHGNKGRKPWYLDRISEESEARRQAEERARAAEELAARLQRGDTNNPPNTPANDADVETRARQIADERVNGDKIRSVISAGISNFTDWDQKAEMLGAVGAASPAFVLDVVSVDPVNAHVILHQLADDPQKAAHLAKMDTRARTIELVKMSMAANASTAAPAADTKPAPQPKTVSKAPAPPPAIEPGSAPSIDWRSDKASDADFSKGWEENARKRALRR